ncbi:hypothetical protein FPV67DRAFT_315040 [Lyophyllum atratum]|nr:hypothetical protein FPV67DRAFT_315040 [Lyophyllum atratum]
MTAREAPHLGRIGHDDGGILVLIARRCNFQRSRSLPPSLSLVKAKNAQPGPSPSPDQRILATSHRSMQKTVAATTPQLPRDPCISNVTEISTLPPSIRPTHPHDSDSTTNNSLTRKNIKLHNALQTQQHDSESDLPNDIHIQAEISSSSSRSSSPSPDSSRILETPRDTNHSLFPSGLDSTDLDSECRSNHVHFRPRVRITSGISRHRHKHSTRTPDRSFDAPLTPNSSRSSSPSSSISAPLRTRTDDESDKPGWGPLGQRVALLSRERRRTSREQRQKKRHDEYFAACEHTPLLRPRIQSPILQTVGHYEGYFWDSDQESETAQVSSEIDRVFGTMPRRLLNYHWWWWQLEPIVCCSCLDESDIES